jgi:hypothetical protein
MLPMGRLDQKVPSRLTARTERGNSGDQTIAGPTIRSSERPDLLICFRFDQSLASTHHSVNCLVDFHIAGLKPRRSSDTAGTGRQILV